MDIKLSISLLASNREESLERCLASLKPLLAKIPAELIIILTSTDEKIRKIAESYTPHILSFEWCDDFSAARNIGLEASQGEWFLYIDDDEWFDGLDEICRFFLSGEYRDYHSAHYIQRNYQNWNGTEYSDFPVFRMVQRIPGTRFQGAIHEELTPHIEPCKYFETLVHHYGYVKDSGSLQKTSRNIPLLLHAIKVQPEKGKNYIQLAKEFGLEERWKSAEECCRKGAAICKKNEDSYLSGWIQAYRSFLVARKPIKKSAISEIEAILLQEQPTELICLILYQHLIHLYREGEEPEKSLQYGWKFENLLNKMDENNNLWSQQSYAEFSENYIKSPENLYNTRADCVACALETRDFTAALYFLKLFPWETEDILQRYYPCFEQWNDKYSSHFPGMLLEILENLCSAWGIQDILELPEYPDAAVPAYLVLRKALGFFGKGEIEKGLKLSSYCIAHTEDDFLRQLCLNTILYHEISIIPLVAKMNLDAWNHLLETAAKELPFTLNDRIRICEEEAARCYPLHSLCMKRHRLEQKLRKGFPLWDELVDTLEEYCLCILEFYGRLYRKEWLSEENLDFFPKEYRFARISLKALAKLREERMAEAVRLFGDSLRIYPDMTGVITEIFRQAACRMDDPALHAGEEFLQLAEQMKETLHTLIAAGQTAQAGAVLDQLLPLMPEDLELIKTRQELIRRTRP